MKMIIHKIFYIGLLICLVSLTNKVSAQFVPMQSAQYKHLAADTLYDFTGNGAPTVHPRSYKRVVTYFDSTNGIPYWHNPKTQTWVTVSGGGGTIDSADYANLSFGYGFIIFDENPYNPATGAKAVALDTALINRYIDSVIATDTTISQNVGVFDYVVDTVSNAPPVQPDGYKVLVGTSPTGAFSGHANQVATKVGGVYTYVTPTANQTLEVRNQTQLLFYKYDGANWHLISIGDLIGGISGIYQPDIGTRDSNSFTIKTKNIPAIRIDEAQDVYLPKFIGIPSNNFAKFDTITGKFTYDVFHPFSLTTTGTSGPATFDPETGVLNVPQYAGGAGTETWEQTLQTQGSTPFTTDNTVDFDTHSLTLNNISNLNITSNTNVTQFSLHGDAENGSFENINDTLNAGMYTHIEPTVPLESFLRLRTLYADNSIVQNEQLLDIAPRYAKFSGHINNQPKAQVIFEDIDTLLTEPEFVYVSDNDTIKKYPYSGGGGGTGTVTSFSSGDLSPLFTTSVATSTSTPALSFSLSNAAANTVLGNATGSTAAPSYSQIVNGQITNATIVASTKLSATGTPSSSTYLRGDNTWSTIAGATTPAGNYGNLQLNRNGAFNTPASDSLSFNSGVLTNLGSTVIKGTATITTTATGTAGTDSVLVESNGLVKKISPAYYTDVVSGASNRMAYFNTGTQLTTNANYLVDPTNGFFGLGGTTPTARLHLSGNISAPAWTTSGIAIKQDAATYTATTGSGSVAFVAINTLGAPTIAASSATNFTEAATLYLPSTPVAGSNVTIAVPLALYVGARSKFNAQADFAGAVNLNGTTTAVAINSTGKMTTGGTMNAPALFDNAFRVSPTITQTGSAGYRAVFVSPFENTLGSGSRLLLDIGTNTAANAGGTHTSKLTLDALGNLTTTRPITTSGSTPGIAAGTGAGTSPTVSVTGNDAAGYVSIATGTSPTASGNIVTITFNTALLNTPKAITLTAANANAATEIAKFYVDQSTASTTSFVIKNTSSGLTASTTYLFYYTVTE